MFYDPEEECGEATVGLEGDCPLYISDHWEDIGYFQWNQGPDGWGNYFLLDRDMAKI